MIAFLTHWTKKKIIISAAVLALVAGVAFCVVNFSGDGNGTDDVILPGAGETTVTYEKPEGTVADYTSDPKKNLFVANGVLTASGSFRSDSVGLTVTKSVIDVKQEIRAMRIVKGESVFKQSASFGLVKIGDQRIAIGENYMYRTAKKLNAVDDIVWNVSSPVILDKSSFTERYGCRGNGFTSYILTDETIVDCSYDGYDETTGLYEFSYVLDTEKATPQILCEMRTNAGTKKYPTFTRAKISVTMDKDWVVKTLSTDCEYEVPLMGGQKCEEKMTETFSEIGQIDSIKSCPDYDYFSNFISSSLSPSQPPKDTPATDDDTAPDAITALTSMFSEYVEGSPLNTKLTLNACNNDLSLDVTAILNVADLAKTKVYAKTESGISIAYDNGNVLVKSNDVKFLLSVEDAKRLLSDFIGKSGKESADNDSNGFDLSSFDPSRILDAMTVDSDDETITVTIPLESGSFKITAVLTGKKTADGYEFLSAEVTSDVFNGIITTTGKTLSPLGNDNSFINLAEVVDDYYDVVKHLIFPTSDNNETGTVTTNRAYSFTLSPVSVNLGKASVKTKAITANLFYSPKATVLDLNEVCFTVDTNGKTIDLAFALKLAVTDENVEKFDTATDKKDFFEILSSLLSSRKIFVTAKELGSERTFNLSVKGNTLADLLLSEKDNILSFIPSKDSLKSNFNVQKILDLIDGLVRLDYDRKNDKTLSLTVNGKKFNESLGDFVVALSQPKTGGITLGLKTPDTDVFSLNVKSLEAPSSSEILSAYDFAANHKDVGDAKTLVEKFKSLSKLLPTIKSVVEGSPLNLNVSTSISGTKINAILSATLNANDLSSSVLAIKTERGIRATYSDNLVLVAINNLALKLNIDDIGIIAERFGKKLPDFDIKDVLTDIDLIDILNDLIVGEEKNTISVELPITVKGKSILISAAFIGDENGKFTMGKAKISVDDAFDVTLSSSTLSVTPLSEKTRNFVNAAEVVDDYSDVIEEISSLNRFGEKSEAKSFDFVLNEFSFGTDACYTIGKTTFGLFLSKNKIVFGTDSMSVTTAEGDKSSTKELSLKVAYEKFAETEKLFVTVNDKVNADSELRFSVSKTALDSFVNKRFPELLDAVPQLKELINLKLDTETLLDFSSMISSLTYERAAEKLLSIAFNSNENSTTIFNGFILKLSHNSSDSLKLSVEKTEPTLSENGITLSIKKTAATVDNVAAAYDTTASHISLDSIDTLLESFVLTSKRASFRMTGTVPVNLTALGFIKADINLGLDVRVDIERTEGQKDVVYVAAKLSRGKIDGIENTVFKDDGGDSYIFYDGAAKTITTARNSLNKKKWCKKCESFNCKNKALHWGLYFEDRWAYDTELTGTYGYLKTLTESEFKSDFVPNFLEVINFIDSINNAIIDATNKEKTPYGIDDVIKDYSYSSPVYAVKIDLKPIDNVLGSANVNISHDENYELTKLSGDIKLLDISGVSCKGTFEIDLVDSVVGDAKSLATNKTVF